MKRNQLTANEAILVGFWQEHSPDSSLFADHLRGLRKVIRVKPTSEIGIYNSRSPAKIYPVRKPESQIPVLAISFTNNDSREMAVCFENGGAPSGLQLSCDIWKDSQITILEGRSIDDSTSSNSIEIAVAQLPTNLANYASHLDITCTISNPYSYDRVDLLEWCLNRHIPPNLMNFLLEFGCLSLGDICSWEIGFELWRYPEATIVPIYGFDACRRLIGLNFSDPAGGVIGFDQVSVELRSFGDEIESAFEFLLAEIS